MSHRSSQRRNLAAPESKTCPSHYSDPIQEPYKPSFLVRQLSSLTLTYDKHPPPFDTPSHPKPTTTSSILHSSKSNAHNTVKKTPRENPQKPCLELERKRLQGSVKSDPKGVANDVKVENPRVGKRRDIERMGVSLAQSGGRRRSFCGSQVNLGDIFAINGVKMVSADMPPFMQIHAIDSARKAFDSMEKFTSKTLALSLKKEFDGVYGPAWHCIVGTSFGSFVTHSVGGFLYFSLDQKLYVLLFKTAVQRAS